jgi:hypothetical protein
MSSHTKLDPAFHRGVPTAVVGFTASRTVRGARLARVDSPTEVVALLQRGGRFRHVLTLTSSPTRPEAGALPSERVLLRPSSVMRTPRTSSRFRAISALYARSSPNFGCQLSRSSVPRSSFPAFHQPATPESSSSRLPVCCPSPLI